MHRTEAFKIVLDLAKQNTYPKEITLESELERQMLAISIIETLAFNMTLDD